MNPSDLSWIPPQYQIVTTIFVGFFLAVVAVSRYFKELKKPPSAKQEQSELRILGAAFNDTRSLSDIARAAENIAKAAAEMRAITDRQAERDLAWRREITSAIHNLIESINSLARTHRRN